MNRFLRCIIPIVIGCGLTMLLLKKVDLRSVEAVFHTIKLPFFFWALFFGLISHLINGLRFKLCLGNKISVQNLVAISSVHMLVLNFMPFRSGEITFPVLTGKYGKSSLSDALSGLALVRFWDISIFFLLSILSCFICFYSIKPLFILTLCVAVSSSVLLLLCLLLIFIGAPAVNGILNLVKGNSVRRVLLDFVYFTNQIKSKSNRSMNVSVASLSLFYWGLVVLQTYVFFISFQYIDIFSYLVFFAIINLWALLPIHGFLALGTNEAAFIFIITHLNIDISSATGIAIGFHILVLLSSILLGVIGSIFLTFFLGRSSGRHN